MKTTFRLSSYSSILIVFNSKKFKVWQLKNYGPDPKMHMRIYCLGSRFSIFQVQVTSIVWNSYLIWKKNLSFEVISKTHFLKIISLISCKQVCYSALMFSYNSSTTVFVTFFKELQSTISVNLKAIFQSSLYPWNTLAHREQPGISYEPSANKLVELQTNCSQPSSKFILSTFGCYVSLRKLKF